MAAVQEPCIGMGGETYRRRRVLMFPVPLPGHTNPMMQLADVLHARGGFAVTVLHVTRLSALDPERHPEFQFVPVPDGVPDHVVASSSTNALDVMEAMNAAMEADESKVLGHVLASVLGDEGQPPAACIIFDGSLLAVPKAAAALGLPSLVFSLGSAACFRCILAYPMLHEKGYLPRQESKLDMPVKELPPLRVRDLFYTRLIHPEAMKRTLAGVVEAVKKSSGLLMDTNDALEIAEVQTIREELHIPLVLATGPLHKLSSSKSTGSSFLEQDLSSIEWLDQHHPESVLYVSFGSLASLDSNEFLEVAWGLANSGHPFLWVVRPDLVRGLDGRLDFPNGFEAAIDERGKMIRWAPQQEVLAHPEVGGFWTHSGWNSTLESICEGVPMICRPQFADQMMNVRYVVNTWGVGLELEGKLERGNIEKAIRKLMKEREGEEMRAKANELKKKMGDCLEGGGSSQIAIDKLVNYILSM